MEHSEGDGPTGPPDEEAGVALHGHPAAGAAVLPDPPAAPDDLREGDVATEDAKATVDTTEEVAIAGSGPTEQVVAVTPLSSTPFLPPQWTEPKVSDEVGPGLQWGVRSPDRGQIPPVGTSWSPDLSPPPPRETAPSTGHRSSGLLWGAVALGAALIGALVGGEIVAASNHNGASATVKEISAGPALLNGVTNIESVIAKVLPAVVSIDATSSAPLTQSLFGGSNGGSQEDQGTGMIITSNGEVVTNNHVIAGATNITVTLYGSLKALPATLIDTDPANDVALLQITNASNLPTVTYGNSDNVQVGDAVVAIGNALGLSAGTPTVTQGIISAKGRTVQASDSSGNVTETLTNMFQTDAAINPGNSGGPLVDSSGRVIGMNAAVAASADGTSQAQNIGFAIPSNKIRQLLPELRTKSVTQRGPGYLGVDIETITSQLRAAYNFVPTQGAVVTQVVAGSPAGAAGLQQGDVIVSFDGKQVTSADQLATAIQAGHPGQRVSIGLYRGQSQMTVTATLGSDSRAQPGG